MKKLAFLLGLSLMLILIGQANAYTQGLYYYNTTTAADFNYTAYLNVTSDLESCYTTVDVYADITGTTGTFINFYIYEGAAQLGSTIQMTSSNVSCAHVATRTASSSDTNITTRFLNIGTPAEVTAYTEIRTACGLVTNATILLTTAGGLLPTPYKTDNGYLQHFPFNYSLYSNATLMQGVIDAWHNLTPSHCSRTNKEVPTGYVTLLNTTLQYFFVPFNSGVGTINITGAVHSSGFSVANIGLLIPSTGDVNILYYTSSNYFEKLNYAVQPATDYVLWISYAQSIFTPTQLIPPNINITLTDYEANYNCTAWSACDKISHQQARTCTDLGGLAPDRIQTRSCMLVNQTAVLGFENYYAAADRQVCVPGYLCLGKTLLNISPTYFPDNPRWSIAPDNILYYLASITSEESTLGSRSLKMWYIPPSHQGDQAQQAVVGNVTTVVCNDSLEGVFPQSFLVLNTTFAASLDFTFPAGTTELKFDVKRCDKNAVQYNNICGHRCYSQNCSVAPSGDFVAALYDQVEKKNLFEYTKEASSNWTTYTAFVGNAVEDRNYTLIFSVLPIPWSSVFGYGNCVYFDNVRLVNTATSIYDQWADAIYNSTWADLTDDEKQQVLLIYCVDGCRGNDFYQSTIQDLTCIETVTLNDSTCVAQAKQQQYGNQSIFQPINSIANTVVNETTRETLAQSWQASGFGFALVFITPIFWIMLLIAVVMVLAAYATKHMEIGVGAGLVILIAFTFALPELIIITILLIVIVAYIVGRTVVKTVSGGG